MYQVLYNKISFIFVSLSVLKKITPFPFYQRHLLLPNFRKSVNHSASHWYDWGSVLYNNRKCRVLSFSTQCHFVMLYTTITTTTWSTLAQILGIQHTHICVSVFMKGVGLAMRMHIWIRITSPDACINMWPQKGQSGSLRERLVHRAERPTISCHIIAS